MPVPALRVVRCAPRTHPCPRCGTPGRRKRSLSRRIRSLAYRQVAHLEVRHAEYQARCGGRKTFRSWPLEVPAKAGYDDRVRQAVLDRLLEDGLNVERPLAAMRRDFLLTLSQGFVYDCLRWQVARRDRAPHRRLVVEKFSGTLCVDELHLGRFTLLMATDPVVDLPVAFALVGRNDQGHMRRFLKNLRTWGRAPEVVISDGSALYPAVLAERWPAARPQLCVFHVLKDVNALIVAGVRRLAHAMARRGKAGRKRRRGRPRKAGPASRTATGPTRKEKAGFVLKHRFLVVKKASEMRKEQWEVLGRMFDYLPELRTPWYFACEAGGLFEREARVQTLWKRRAALLRKQQYEGAPGLSKAMGMLEAGKFEKMVAVTSSDAGRRVRTNNHVERANRRLRFWEKLRYKWRRRRWVVRFVLLAMNHWWRQAAVVAPQGDQAERAEYQPRRSPPRATG